MEVIHERCAGLDVHKETVVACLRVRERGQVTREVRRWATTTAFPPTICWRGEKPSSRIRATD